MTGYAVIAREIAAGTLTVELKSVNSRFLDLQFRINDELRACEPALREAIMARVARGKLECRVSFARKATAGAGFVLNAALLVTLSELQRGIHRQFDHATPLSVHDLLRWPGVIEEAQIVQETLQADIGAALSAALESFLDSRQREGAALAAMLMTRIDEMEAIVQRITPLIPHAIAQFQQKAVERVQEALGLALQNSTSVPLISLEEARERIRQEVTLYGVRVDISEELTRLSAHLAEVRHILNKGGQVGKRLDFMMQELNREANTLGSKAPMKELSDACLALKLLIEQMREQVQNLE